MRENWSSKIGFVLAASGSAIGLGNIWKYPHMAGENGGAAFTILYVFCVIIVGLPLLLGEIAIGKKTQLNPVGAFKKLDNKGKSYVIGLLGIVTAFIILSFYSVVGGWTLHYFILSINNKFNEFSMNLAQSEAYFNTFTKGIWIPIKYNMIFMFITIIIVLKGIKKGIELWTKLLMPTIILILIFLAIKNIGLPGGLEGIKFLFLPKWSDLSASSIVLALGHAFFTLSLGMGCMLTYGSYIKGKDEILKSAIWIMVLDTVIALIAGVAIFTTVFALGGSPSSGPGLVFIMLPSILNTLKGGILWSILFFGLLFIAAITSSISLLEVITSYLIDERKWSRKKATLIIGLLITITGILCSLSIGNHININLFHLFDTISAKYMLPIGGLLTGLFIIKKWKTKSLLAVCLNKKKEDIKNTGIMTAMLTVSIILITFIFLNELIKII